MANKTKMPTDVNQRAKAIVDFATGTEDVPDLSLSVGLSPLA